MDISLFFNLFYILLTLILQVQYVEGRVVKKTP